VVVSPVSSNTAIERCGVFAVVMRTRIGSPYVIEGMEAALAQGAHGVVGFEANGGFLVGDMVQKDGRKLAPLPTRDAVLPMLCLLAIAQENGTSLSQLSVNLPQRFTASDRIQDFSVDASRALLSGLAESRAAISKLLVDLSGQLVDVNQTDGLRMTFANGEIIHLRPSGNAPELRCYAEAMSAERAQSLVNETLARIVFDR
jgi:phosphomannomutase